MSALTSTAVLVMVIIGASCESSGTKTRVRSPDDTLNLSPVPIVGNDGPGFPDARLLSLREDLRLGTSFGPSELEFQQVRVIATDRAGNIYVGNNGSGQIRVFDHEGRFLRSVGRVGDGPGDFRSFAYLFFIGDTLIVADDGTMRTTWIDPNGRMLGTWSISVRDGSVMPGAATDNGFIGRLAPRPVRLPPVGTLSRDTVRLVWLPTAEIRSGGGVLPSNQPRRTIAEYPGRARYTTSSDRGRTGVTRLWEFTGASAFDGNGNSYVHSGLAYRIHVYDSSARLIHQIERPHQPIPVTEELLERYRKWVDDYFRPGNPLTSTFTRTVGPLRSNALARAQIPPADQLPALGRMFASRNGSVWVERPDLVDDPARAVFHYPGRPAERWDIFHPDGHFRGTVELPDGFFIMAVTENSAFGFQRDKMGVEYVVRLTLSQ